MFFLNKKIYIYSVFFFGIAVISLFLLLPDFTPFAAAQDRLSELGGLKNTGSELGYNTGDLEGETGGKKMQVAAVVGRVISTILSLLGVILMIVILLGAVKIAGAHGNEEEVKFGKERIKTGFIGMLTILSAYLLTKISIAWLTGGGFSFTP